MRDEGDAEAAGAANPLGRPCGNPDAMGYVQQRSRFGYVCAVTVEGHRRGC